jgi:cell division protein ZapA
MSKSDSERVEVQILDRSYSLSCTPEDKPMLLQCVDLVDTRMRQAKTASKLQGNDRIAVMAALTLARDLLMANGASDKSERDEALARIASLSASVDTALMPQEKLF